MVFLCSLPPGEKLKAWSGTEGPTIPVPLAPWVTPTGQIPQEGRGPRRRLLAAPSPAFAHTQLLF